MTPTRFRLLIAAYLVCVVLAIVGHVVTAAGLPPALYESVKLADSHGWMSGWVGITFLVTATVATIGLILFKAWARPLFAAVTAFGAMPWDGATVYPAMEYAFINLEFVLAGAVIAAAYWPAVRERFEPKA